MKQWLTRLIAIAVVIAVGFWLWQVFFPSPERIIHNRMARIAKLISFSSNEGNIARMADVSSLLGYFTPDIQCTIDTPDIPDAGDWSINGREDLRDNVVGARSMVGSLRVDFVDVTVTFAPDHQTAAVELTARVSLPNDRDFIVHEMKFTFRNVKGEWLVSRVETVKTLG